MTVEERAALPCVQTGRAPVIVAGAVIVLAAMETLGYEELTVSERDLLDGLVLRRERANVFAPGGVASPEWRNGRRNGLKHRRAMPVRVRVPPPALG